MTLADKILDVTHAMGKHRAKLARSLLGMPSGGGANAGALAGKADHLLSGLDRIGAALPGAMRYCVDERVMDCVQTMKKASLPKHPPKSG